MTDSFVLEHLNEQQLDIVCRSKDEDILVIAGAGTGKTRVLISRICSLLTSEGVPPHSILAVTFTNKAAMEMKDRLIKSMNWTENDMQMWVTTFHSLCARLLHLFHGPALLPPEFTVIGPKDQQHLIKDFLDKKNFTKSFTCLRGRPKEFGLDVAGIVNYINRRKEKGLQCTLKPNVLMDYMERFETVWPTQTNEDLLEIFYGIYNIICERSGAVDFSELILRTVWLLRTNADVRERLNNRFRYILVDEFQDTDSLQYQLVKLLKGPNTHIFVVGDDDQAIYGWRGADYKNLNRLIEDTPNIKLLPLGINYRSSQNILNFANSLIFQGKGRVFQKRLFTPVTYEQQRALLPDASPSLLSSTLPKNTYDLNAPKVVVARIDSEALEGRNVALLVNTLHNRLHVPLSEIAIIYRKNSLSANIERELNAKDIPYQVYGGLKFYERAEVLDAIAYLRLMSNPNDDIALSRIYNVPKRKIGATSWNQLSAFAESCGCSVYQAIQQLKVQEEPLREVKTLIKKFDPVFDLIERMSNEIEKRSLPNLINYMLHETGLLEHYKQVDKEKGTTQAGISKVDNLMQLIVNAGYFMSTSSLQDIDIHKVDINEILPLPNDEYDEENSDLVFSDDFDYDDDELTVGDDDDVLIVDHSLVDDDLLDPDAKVASRKVSEADYIAKVTRKPQQAKLNTEHKQKKDSLTLAAEKSASISLDEQNRSSAALGLSVREQLNAFLRSASLTASTESNGVGQIPLAGLEIFDKELSEKLQQANMEFPAQTREQDLLERARTDLDAFQELGDLKGGKRKSNVDSVQLMTIHSAKGLEFEAVIVIGCEQETLPSSLAMRTEHGITEERRLAYVAFTRAKRYLIATFSRFRDMTKYGKQGSYMMEPSIFLKEAEAETKHLRNNAPYVNVQFGFDLNESQLVKLLTPEVSKKSKAKEPNSPATSSLAKKLLEKTPYTIGRGRPQLRD